MPIYVDPKNTNFFEKAHLLRDVLLGELMHFQTLTLIDTNGDGGIIDLCINTPCFYDHPTQEKHNFYGSCVRFCDEVKNLVQTFRWQKQRDTLAELDRLMKAAKNIYEINEDKVSIEELKRLVKEAWQAIRDVHIPEEGVAEGDEDYYEAHLNPDVYFDKRKDSFDIISDYNQILSVASKLMVKHATQDMINAIKEHFESLGESRTITASQMPDYYKIRKIEVFDEHAILHLAYLFAHENFLAGIPYMLDIPLSEIDEAINQDKD